MITSPLTDFPFENRKAPVFWSGLTRSYVTGKLSTSTLYQERKWEMEAANMVDSHSLYTESSRLRALARMLEGNGDVERPDITFTAIELDGFASLLAAVADDIDAYRDL